MKFIANWALQKKRSLYLQISNESIQNEIQWEKNKTALLPQKKPRILGTLGAILSNLTFVQLEY